MLFFSGVTQEAAVISTVIVGDHQRALITLPGLGTANRCCHCQLGWHKNVCENPLTSRRAQICTECTTESTLLIIN